MAGSINHRSEYQILIPPGLQGVPVHAHRLGGNGVRHAMFDQPADLRSVLGRPLPDDASSGLREM